MLSLHMTRWVAAFLLALTLWQSGAVLVSSLYSLQAQRMIDKLVEGSGTMHGGVPGNIPGSGTFAKISEKLQLAIRVDPYNPTPVRMMGDQYSGVTVGTPGFANRDAAIQALDWYRKSLQMSGDAVTWAKLFFIKAYLGEVDEELVYAAKQTSVLGPFEPTVHYYVISAGTANWLQLPAAVRTVVLATSVRALMSPSHFQRKVVLDIIESRGFLPLVCAFDGGAPVIRSVCSSAD